MNTTDNVIVTYYNSNEVSYEGDTNQYSNLTSGCATVTSAIEDLYEQVNDTYINFDETDFPSTQDGITYPTELTAYKVLKEHHLRINNILQEIEEIKNGQLCNMLITNCSLELGGIVDECGNTPETFEDLINIILQNLDNG